MNKQPGEELVEVLLLHVTSDPSDKVETLGRNNFFF